MIDDIVERILTEARGKDREDVVSKIYSVMMEIDIELAKILTVLSEKERRKKDNENKG